MENELPHKTVIRLSRYHRLLEKYKYMDEPHIFSHDLARMLELKAVNVRHDLMLLGFAGDRHKGYSVIDLLEKIEKILDPKGRGVILIGMGRLGKSLITYLNGPNTNMKVLAAFDIQPEEVNSTWEGVVCHSIADLPEILEKHEAPIAILAIPPDDVDIILPLIITAGIKGILNYTSEHLVVPDDVYVRDVDMIAALEEIGYFMGR